ncbi:MAG: precorrin-3B C(17)-methyltransferase [Chloroflexi bacterium]|nr:precorrin-3B C(17)-methyltransferase [Chloroflexota bacterium]MYD47510.1 precorrin-3B C(17)-methyltransferase [Chloroflexota bacterium]
MNTGKLYLVGIGPGDAGHLTPAAAAAIAESEDLVGYRYYIEQVAQDASNQTLHSMELGQELERAALAVDLAYAGKTVAVVSSGDAGIYGMAGPVFRVLTDRQWDGIGPTVETVPGVSALQSSAALLGSPLMQDFCAISLSNLLTPWEQICRRLNAAAAGDFVAVLYNPRSRRRVTQLDEARRIFLEHRPATTPVGVVRHAFRPEQAVSLSDLSRLDGEQLVIDMFTTVVIGNSNTYVHNGRMVTPRGYEAKQ